MKNSNRETTGTEVILMLLGTIALIGIALGLKAYAVRWLWNDLLISWAGFALPVMGWTKALCVGICLTLSTNSIFSKKGGK